ncbi:MAG TPA: glycosyltransferase family 87 protein [Polyangia bacterium]
MSEESENPPASPMAVAPPGQDEPVAPVVAVGGEPVTSAPVAGVSPARARAPMVWKRPLLVALAVLAALVWFALWRWLQVKWAGPGIGNDVPLYRSYAASWGAGSVPYVGFQPEYPPGALPLFVLPFLYAGAAGNYVLAFAVEMGIFDLGSYALVLLWGMRLSRRPWAGAAALGTLYLALSAALYPVLYTRFDMVPAAIVLAALTLAYPGAVLPGGLAPPLTTRRMFFSAALVGLAGAVKLWPLALGPAWLLLAYRRGRWGLAVVAAVGIGVGALLPVAPLLPQAGLGVLRFLDYHAARGIEIGSTWASLALLLNMGGVYEAWTQHDFGAFHVKGPAADAYARWSTPLLPLGVLLPQIGAWFGRLGREGDERGAEGARVTLAIVLGFMVFGKVLSPQFSLWLVPLLPLVCRNVVLALVALGIAVGTTIEYPFVAAALEMLAPGHKQAVLLVAGRNLLLLGLFVYLCWRVGWGTLVSRLLARLRRPSVKATPASIATSAPTSD